MEEENPQLPSDDGQQEESKIEKIRFDEKEKYEEITEYIKQVDEILDFIKPFPREISMETAVRNPETTPRLGFDHLENLIKLVEQLKDLKEKNSKSQERTQYLKDLKKLHERKKRLKYEAELELKRASPVKFWESDTIPETPTEFKKSKSSLPFRKNSRGRSKSVNIEEEREGRFYRKRFPSQEQEPRRKSSTNLQKVNVNKSKVSKWTKVKEAFRWEKTSDPRSSKSKKDDIHRYLQVPQDKTSESPSDLSGQISACSSVGASSTSCLAAVLSGEHSSEGHSTSSGYALDLLPPPPPPPPPLQSDDDFLSLPLLQDLSSSSSSEKLDELLTYSELLTKGNVRSGSTAESIDVSFHHLDLHHDDELETRRSKSLDGDIILGPSSSFVQHLSKDSISSSKLSKTHKTPWGKVKDIIQTRKDSLKKKPKKRAEEFRRGIELFSVSADLDTEIPEDLSSPEEKPKDSVFLSRPKIEVTSEPVVEQCITPCVQKSESVAARRLTPVLTITLPSTEELRNFEEKGQKPPTPSTEEKTRNVEQHLCQAEYFEDIPKYEKGKTNPYHRRFSRWTKVKRAFLTSTSPTRSPDYLPGLNSVPSSPNRHSSFFSDVESDELSSGEWAEDKIHLTDKTSPETELSNTQIEIQKSYIELQQKLVREFDQKVREWERSKSTDASIKHEENYQKPKIEDWDRIPRASNRQRESMAIPLPTMDDLSPEFKKKLDEWKKIKKSQTTPAVPHVLTKDENPGQHFKMRIGEWQKWRPRSSHKSPSDKHDNLPDEFCKKLEEWQKIKGNERRSRSHSDRGRDENGNRTPSPRLSRKNSKGAIKKMTNSGKSSGTESLSGSLKEKDGRGGSRKVHKEKDLQWLEKELHKIEREKLRLEREREKYLEREARLEQMKKTMGTTSPTQEVLIKTATGFFRFEGISQKFTKKLYEWEKARGIAPEASTFALLEECAKRDTEDVRPNGASFQRSKSMGSVIEISSASVVPDIPHHPSSLSLNDVDELEALEETKRVESRASSEPTLPVVVHDEDEPQAIIVDVEDVVVETAALMADEPLVREEVPIYSYAPEEVTQLIDSSGSDSEGNIQISKVQTKQIDEFENSSSRLIDHNIDLLEKLEKKEAICRKLENDIENIEAQINDDKKNEKDEELTKEQDQLKRNGEDLQHSFAEHSEQQANLAHNLVDNMKLLDVMTSSINQQEAVSRVHELSSQLLCLAEKLESALSNRNEDIKNLKSNLYSRRARSSVNRLQTGQVWFSTDGSSSVTGHDGVLDSSQTSQDLSQLPSLITSKVLELKTGLSILKNATEVLPKPQPTESVQPEIENTASYVVQVSNNGKRNSIIDITETAEQSSSRRSSLARKPHLKIKSTPILSGEDLSPVNVTINPPSFQTEEKIQKLEKSKAQIVYGEFAAQEFEKNSKELIKSSPEVIKRKIKEKISLMQRMTTEGRPRIYKPLEFNYNKHVDDDVTDDESIEVKEEEEEEDQSDEKIIVVKKNGKGSKQRKILKTRRVTDTTIAYNKQDENRTSSEKDDSDDVFLKGEYPKYKNPAYIHFQRRSSNDSGARSSTDVDVDSIVTQGEVESGSDVSSNVNVFVRTTRKIISPVRRDSKGATSSVLSYVIDDIERENDTKPEEEKNETASKTNIEPLWKLKLSRAQSASPGVARKLFPNKKPDEERKSSTESGASMENQDKKDIGIPPLPNSPSSARKSSCKEAAPSIRMMIAKYNQKISEQENASEAGSGTASPVAWRSPISERRVQVQLDGANLLKHGGKFNRVEVQKSASASIIRSPESMSRNTSSESLRGILKSSSVGAMKPLITAEPETKAEENAQSASALRALRIKKAKEEFLSRGPSGQSWTSEVTTPVTPSAEISWDEITPDPDDTKSKNRLSHISVGSESSFDETSISESNNLIKSASAGMINLEQRELLRRSSEGTSDDVEVQKGSKNIKSSSKFGISSIKSKFRKVRMRKAKDRDSGKMNTVSALCRQSLYLDVSNSCQKPQSIPCTSKSCPSSPVLERNKTKPEDTKSWIRNPAKKIFKSKDKDVK